jgi:hypothetical protein
MTHKGNNQELERLTMRHTPEGDLSFSVCLGSVWCDTLSGWLGARGVLCGDAGGVCLRLGRGDTLPAVVAAWCDARYSANSKSVYPACNCVAKKPARMTTTRRKKPAFGFFGIPQFAFNYTKKECEK